jgi:hypothetical protein
MATRRPARESASKRVSQVNVRLSDLRIPWVSGGAPVNIDAKQTGVTEGITAHASTEVGAWRATVSKVSAYERTRCAPIASAANTSAFVTVRRAANAATSLNGGATHWAGLGIPKRSHTVLVTDATSSMPCIISDSGGGSKVSRIDVARRSDGGNPCTRGVLDTTGNLTNVEYTSCYSQRTGYLVRPSNHAVSFINGGADVQPCPQFGAEVDISRMSDTAPPKYSCEVGSLFPAARFGSSVRVGGRLSPEFLKSWWRTSKTKHLSVILISLNRLIERLV